MSWRSLVVGIVIGAAVTYAAASYGGSNASAEHVQTGKLLMINGAGMAHPSGFVFQPDGKSPKQNGSADGTRSMPWNSMWATCDDNGDNCTWIEGDRPGPRIDPTAIR